MRRVPHKIEKMPASQIVQQYATVLGFGNSSSELVGQGIGNSSAEIFGEQYFAVLPQAMAGSISFCTFNGKDNPARRAGDIAASRGTLVLADERLADYVRPGDDQFVLFLVEPKISFIKLLMAMSDPVTPAFLTRFPDSCYIGPNVFVEEGAILGDNVVLYGNNYVYANTVIGNRVHIKPGTVIGGDGYEHTPDRQGNLHFMPHLGGVTIEDDVMIGSCTCIDRGVFSQTLIKSGARIDNLVYIAHNVVVGRNALVMGNAWVGGSTIIGDNTRVAPSASLLNSIQIGANCVIGMGSVVLRDVPSNDVVYGVPAKSKIDQNLEQIPAETIK